MVRYMIDSTDCHNFVSIVSVPGVGRQNVSLFAGYKGGSYEKSSHACGNVNVDIDVDGTHPSADVLDIEFGDATPDTAPGWVKQHNAISSFPAILYCNRTAIHAVANYCAAAGLVVGKDYFWWIAILDGRIDSNTNMPLDISDMTGVVAIQAWSANFFPGLNIDLSIVYNDSWKNQGGFLMALTDTQQAQLYEWTRQIASVLGSAFDGPSGQNAGTRIVAIQTSVAAIQEELQNAPAVCQAPNLKLTTN